MCISLVRLAATKKLAPLAFSSQMMRLWFLLDAMAQAFNAQVRPFFNAKTEIAYFGITGLVMICFAVCLYLFLPLLKKYIHGVKQWHKLKNSSKKPKSIKLYFLTYLLILAFFRAVFGEVH